MKLIGVSAAEFPAWEDSLRGQFETFEEWSQGRWKAEDYRKWVMDRDAQCWVVMDGERIVAAGLTQLHADRCKTCEAVTCAGTDLDAWAALLTGVTEWASAMGCGKFRVQGRPGWERKLKFLGLKRSMIVLDMEL